MSWWTRLVAADGAGREFDDFVVYRMSFFFTLHPFELVYDMLFLTLMSISRDHRVTIREWHSVANTIIVHRIGRGSVVVQTSLITVVNTSHSPIIRSHEAGEYILLRAKDAHAHACHSAGP